MRLMLVDADDGVMAEIEGKTLVKWVLGKMTSGVLAHARGTQLCKINPDLEFSELKGKHVR